ncbi:MAG: DUF3995 domain-containing protein, partial [Actinobacteria bacterium]|nr:DUF3995 domain-containing protein [Actinomycetota bacterium]
PVALFAALWATVALEVVGVVLALALVRPWGRRFPPRLPLLGGKKVPDWTLLAPAWGAGTLLAGHGGLFVGFGLLAAVNGDLTSEFVWYFVFWGPWFVIGGFLFMAAGWSCLRRSPQRRIGIAVSALGAFVGLVLSGTPIVLPHIV